MSSSSVKVRNKNFSNRGRVFAGDTGKRVSFIDIAKGIAMLAVIFSHTGYLPFTSFTDTCLNTFMIPVFLICGGWLFNPYDNWRTFLSKKVRGLVFPYLIFSSVGFLGWMYLRQGYFRAIMDIPPGKIFSDFITGNVLVFNGPLWFIYDYFWALLLVKILYSGFRRTGFLLKAAVTLSMLSISLILMKAPFPKPVSYDLIILFAGYIFFGMLLRQHNHLMNVFRRYVIILIPLYLFGTCINQNTTILGRDTNSPVLFIFNSIIGSMSILWLSRMMEKKSGSVSNAVQFVGKHSLVFLSVHWPALQWTTHILWLSGILNFSNSHPTSTAFYILPGNSGYTQKFAFMGMFIFFTLVSLLSGTACAKAIGRVGKYLKLLGGSCIPAGTYTES